MKNSYKDKIIKLEDKTTTTNKAIKKKMIKFVQRINNYTKSKMNRNSIIMKKRKVNRNNIIMKLSKRGNKGSKRPFKRLSNSENKDKNNQFIIRHKNQFIIKRRHQFIIKPKEGFIIKPKDQFITKHKNNQFII